MSSSPTKEASPSKVVFTEKEERVLKVAWHCLKSPPEIDIDKLVLAYGFNTHKTASNTWGTIKKKLATMMPAEDGSPGPKSTPIKRKKAAAAAAEEENDDELAPTPAKKRRASKKSVKGRENDAVDEEMAENEGAVKEEAGDDE